MGKTGRTRLCVGVDLHKHQFTICAIEVDGGLVEHEAEYQTTADGYQRFCDQLHWFEKHKGYEIELAVETTGNAKYFKNRMEKEGFRVIVVNTNKFKVITLRRWTDPAASRRASGSAGSSGYGGLPTERRCCGRSCDSLQIRHQRRVILFLHGGELVRAVFGDQRPDLLGVPGVGLGGERLPDFREGVSL